MYSETHGDAHTGRGCVKKNTSTYDDPNDKLMLINRSSSMCRRNDDAGTSLSNKPIQDLIFFFLIITFFFFSFFHSAWFRRVRQQSQQATHTGQMHDADETTPRWIVSCIHSFACAIACLVLLRFPLGYCRLIDFRSFCKHSKTYYLCYRHNSLFSCSGRSDEEAPLVASPSSIP